jgi:hypothetical protein
MAAEVVRPHLESLGVQDSHPAAKYEYDFERLTWCAKGAIAALGAVAVLHAFGIVTGLSVLSLLSDIPRHFRLQSRQELAMAEDLVRAAAVGRVLFGLVAMVLFLQWLHLVVRLTLAIGTTTVRGAPTLTFSPGQAVWSFFIPFVNLVRPYRILRDVRELLAPEGVAEPPLRVSVDEGTGYRAVRFGVAPVRSEIPSAPVGWWWAFLLASYLLPTAHESAAGTSADAAMFLYSRQGISDLAAVIAAVLGVGVVRGITARLAERFRRIRHTPADVLSAAGVVVE